MNSHSSPKLDRQFNVRLAQDLSQWAEHQRPPLRARRELLYTAGQEAAINQHNPSGHSYTLHSEPFALSWVSAGGRSLGIFFALQGRIRF